VEATLQHDSRNIMLSIDLTNCPNAISRQELILELLKHEELRPLAKYVSECYPPGMVAWAALEDSWQAIGFDEGCAQGRPLSAPLAAILFQPAMHAAREAMATVAGLDPISEEAAR
jgi:hypothetical protein